MLRDAFFFAKRQGFSRLIFEVDCALLVRQRQERLERLEDRSVIKEILDEISAIGVSFSAYSIVHARREVNQAVHSCAKLVSLQESRFYGMLSPAFLAHNLGLIVPLWF